MFKKTTLKNGLRIITISQKNTEAVTVLVLVKTGSKYEKKDINGISHFLEHMYFKGTKKRPTALAIAETLDKIGGIYNAFTSEEYTGYYAKTIASEFETALDWVSDIFLNSTLAEKEIQKEKGVIAEEVNMRLDHPMTYVNVLWSKLLYGDQPAGWDIIGTKQNIANMTRKKLVNYMNSQYVAANTIVCVAGNVGSDLAVNKVKKYFSKIKENDSEKKQKVVERQSGPELIIQTRKTDQTHLCLGVRAYNLFHKDKYAQKLLSVILGGMMSSRLFVRVREKMGAAYYITTISDADPDTGCLFTQVGVDNRKVEKVISAVLDEYKKISKEKVSAQELKKVKSYIKGKAALLLESSDALASFFANQEILEGKIMGLKEIFKMIDRITASDILKVSKDIFQSQKLNLALIGPFKDKEKFKKILKI